MSLDVYLKSPDSKMQECECDCCGHKHERKYVETLFERNITHNLAKMANAVGIYEEVWRPDELGVEKAGQLIEILEQALEMLNSDPYKYKQYEPENGWGSYEAFVRFVWEYLEACEKFPEAIVEVWR